MLEPKYNNYSINELPDHIRRIRNYLTNLGKRVIATALKIEEIVVIPKLNTI